MQVSGSEKRRNVIPRWKPLALTSVLETGSCTNLAAPESTSDPWFEQAQANFDLNATPENSVDLLDAAIVKNDRRLAIRAAAQVLSRAKDLAPSVVEAAASQFHAPSPHLLGFETDVERHDAGPLISKLRRRAIEFPRDSLALVELARLHAISGSQESAKAAMVQALSNDPDSRFILRSATRLFTFLGEPDRALHHLRRSDRLADDPLVQSAEIATSELADKGSKSAAKALRLVRGSDKLPLAMSELGMALATLEQKSGAKRRDVMKFITSSIANPTENALAQAVWLVEHVGLQFTERFSKVLIPVEASEARALQLIEFEDFQSADVAASLWFKDQPFQSRGPLLISTINFCYLGRFERAAEIAENGLYLHHEDWRLANSATIARARAGQIDLAQAHLRRLKQLAKDDESLAFVYAAQGLIAFTKDDPLEGERNYELAMRTARKAKRPDLVLTAAMFYAEMVAQRPDTSPEEIAVFCERLEMLVNRNFPNEKDEVQRLWRARKFNIYTAMAEGRHAASKEAEPVYHLGTISNVPGQLLEAE